MCLVSGRVWRGAEQMTPLLSIWHMLWPDIQALGYCGIGWYCRLAATKAQTRRDRLDAGQQALSLAASLTARDQMQSAALDVLRRREWALAGAVQDVYAEAIAARLIVHDLDAVAGRPLRQFRPLPPYPFPAQGDNSAAGATAAETAEPRADDTHG